MFFHDLAGLPVILGATLFIGAVVAASLGGAFLFHRFVRGEVLQQHNEIAGFVFAVVGVVYAVLLAFFAIGVWERFEAAEMRTYDEAGRLMVVYRKADLFPQVHTIRSEVARYTKLVSDREWSEMYAGGHDPEARLLIERIAFQVRHLRVTSLAQQNVHAAMVASLDDVLVDRDYRIALGTVGVNGFLWAILVAGAVATIVFSYLFAYKSRWSRMTIVGLLAFTLGLVLYLIAAVDYPFRGEVRVGPEAFIHALQTYDTIGR